jgi:IS1 family transposase
MGSFAEARKQQLSKWMAGPEGEALAEVFGSRQDELLLELKQAVKARFPNLALENDTVDALPHLGAERKMWRFPREDYVRGPLSQYAVPALTFYAERLHMAPLLWYWGGTKSAMYNVFAPVDDTYTPPTETWRQVLVNDVEVTVNRHEPSTSSKLHVINDCEGPVVAGDHWSAYAMVFDARDGEWDGGPDWDGWSWDDGHLWDTNMTTDEARYILFQVLAWKSVISYPVRLALWLPGGQEFWNAAGDWDEGWLWGDTPASDTPYLTIGHCWEEHAGQSGWIDDASPNTIQVWDDGHPWGGFENPVLFGVN